VIENRSLQALGRVILLGVLLVVFLFMLLWALNPSRDGGLTMRAEDGAPEEDPGNGVATPAPEPTEPEPTEPEPEAEPTPEGPPPEELIAAAAEPAETTVQVLDAGGGPVRTLSVTETLEELGYNVTNVTSSRSDVATTTVWFTEGDEPQGLALRARDPRFAEVAPNERLNEGVNLHVLVGPDWG
jgi:hypothetical protein